jgi:hypothetical protein
VTKSVLPFVLAASGDSVEPNLDQLDSTRAQRVARFWAGKWTGSQAKALCIERLKSAWRDPKRIAEIVAALRLEHRAVLAIVRRYGGSISGSLLHRELLARGIVKEPKREDRFSYRREADPVDDLYANLFSSVVTETTGPSDLRGTTRVCRCPAAWHRTSSRPRRSTGRHRRRSTRLPNPRPFVLPPRF